MPRFAANLSTMYTEHNFLDRFAAAARDGFKAVEFPFHMNLHRDSGGTAQRQWIHSGFGSMRLPAISRRASEVHGFAWARDGVSQGISARTGIRARSQLSACPCHGRPGCFRRRPCPHARHVCSQPCLGSRQAQAEGVDVLIEPIAVRNIPGDSLSPPSSSRRRTTFVAEIGSRISKSTSGWLSIARWPKAIWQSIFANTLAIPGRAGSAISQIAGVPERHEPELRRSELRLPLST